MQTRMLACLGILAVLFVSGCSQAGNQVSNSTNNSEPSYTNPQTLDELKQAKEQGKSEFDKCMKEFDANKAKVNECVSNTLIEMGYTDRVSCSEKAFNEPPCDNITRNNAEVDAYNECIKIHPFTVNLIDCSKLIGK